MDEVNVCKVNNQVSRRQIIVIILYLLLLSLYLLFVARLNFDNHHDGTIFKACSAIVHGKSLFKDVHTQYGPLFTYIQAGFLWMFGDSLIAMKMSGCVFVVGCHLLFLLIFLRFLSFAEVMLGELLLTVLASYNYYVLLPWSTVFSMFFLLLCVLFVLLSLERQNNNYCFLTGISCACSFFCKQSLGALLFLGIIFSFILLMIKKKTGSKLSMTKFLGGVSIVVIIFVLVFVSQGSLSDWFRQSIIEALDFWNRNSTLSARWNNMSGDSFTTKIISSVSRSSLLNNGVINRIVKAICCLFPVNDFSYSSLVPFICLCFFLWSFFKDSSEVSTQRVFLGIIALVAWGGCYVPVSTIGNRWYAFYFLIGYFLLAAHVYLKHLAKSTIVYTILLSLVIMILFINPVYNNFFAKKDYVNNNMVLREATTARCVGMLNKCKNYNKKWDKEELSQLRGMSMSAEQYVFYNAFSNAINDIKDRYPDSAIYNFNALYVLSIVQDSSLDYPLYIDDYDDVEEYLKREKPIVITYENEPRAKLLENIKGYEIVDSLRLEYPPILYLGEGNGKSIFFWHYDDKSY